MNAIAPVSAAADWDNVGLIVGDRAWPARRVLLTIDLTAAVLDEAAASRFDAVVSYHPVVFKATKRLVIDRRQQEGIAAECLARRVAVYSPHTALDAAPGGTNDTLAGLAGLTALQPFSSMAAGPAQCKVVVFVPESALDAVAEAVFAAGAGRIGAYEKCSYRLNGQGTFFGTDSTVPAVGQKGRLERVDEVRLEVICAADSAAIRAVTAAIRSAHPYEEPAFDIYPLVAIPNLTSGQGRIGRFEKATTLGTLAARLKKASGATAAAIVGDHRATLTRGLVCVGAAGDLPFAIPGGVGVGDVIVTGEMRHHDALRVQRCGATAIVLGHWTSERPALGPLGKALAGQLPGMTISVSQADADPLEGV